MQLSSLTFNLDAPLDRGALALLQEFIQWLNDPSRHLETDEYTIALSDDPGIAFVAVPVDGSSLCYVISSCGRFAYPVVLCSNCGLYVQDEEITYREELSAQVCDPCFSCRD